MTQWSLGSADLESALRFLKFQPQNSFLGKFKLEKSKFSVLPENWHTWYLKDANSYSSISFQNFQSQIYFKVNLGQKSQSCLFCLQIGTQNILRMLILILTIVFWISKLNPFLGKFGPEKPKLSVLPEHWHAWYPGNTDSYSEINFVNFKT